MQTAEEPLCADDANTLPQAAKELHDEQSDSNPPAKGRRSLLLRAAACLIAATVLACLPHLDSWRAHACLGVFIVLIFAQLAVPEAEGATLVVVGLAVLGITDTLGDASGKGLWSGFGETVTWLVTYAVVISITVTRTVSRALCVVLLATQLQCNTATVQLSCSAIQQ